MRIEDLDEFQGMTPQMVREWLQELDPAIKPSDSMADDIRAVSELCGETPQALLREINPRMRKGMPSDAAINAHADRHWVAKSSQRGGVTRIIEIAMGRVVMVQTLSETQRIDLNHLPDGWHYWPCDEHGNKVRWPEKDGVML